MVGAGAIHRNVQGALFGTVPRRRTPCRASGSSITRAVRARSTELKAEIDYVLREGEEQGYKPLFYQFGWWQLMAEIGGLFMFDSVCGDYNEAHALTKRVIDYIHEKGLRTYLYTNAIAVGDESIRIFRTRPELLVRDPAGFHVDTMPVIRC